MDDELPSAEAIAIDGNLISAVGTNDEVLSLQTGGTELRDLQGRTVVPGLIEAHSHRLLGGFWSDGPEGLVRATQTMAANGYTTVHELFGDLGLIETAQSLAQEGRLAVRINVYVPYNSNCGEDWDTWTTYPYTVKKDTILRVAGVKIFADGGSCGYPALTTLYQAGSAEGTYGDLFKTQEEMNATVEEVLNAGYPIAMHALGDWGVEVGLNAFENAFSGGGNTLRSRMEHLRVMREDLADQMAALGIGASIQYSWARNQQASRFETIFEPQVLDWLFPWRRIVDRGIPIIGGNDPPYAARTQAMQTISYLATRKDHSYDVLPAWMDGDQLTVEEGLKAMTVNNAWFAFEEDVKGTITSGKLADLTVLSDDPFSMDPFDVRYITVEMTIMDGVIRHNQMGISHTAIHDAGSFSMGIDDRGLWGPFRSQMGLIYDELEYLWRGYLMISYDSTTVGSAALNQQDFVTSPGGWVDFQEPGTIADEEVTVIYEDAADWHPSTLQITQKSFMWDSDSLLLVKYKFTNIGDEPLSDLYLGQWMDFDVGYWADNMGGWDNNEGLGFAYMYNVNDPNTPYIGVAMFDSSGNYVNTSLVFTANYMLSSDESIFSEPMRNNIFETGTPSPGDYVIFISTGPISLDINQSISPFMLAFVVGDDLNDVKNAVNKAYVRAIMSLDEEIIPGRFVLYQNYPNPFNPITTLRYDLPELTNVRLTIYDLLGREVKTLVNGVKPSGFYEVSWDGTDSGGRFVGAGVYLYQIQAGEYAKTHKMVLIR